LEGVTVSISYIGGSLDPGGSHYILGLIDLEDHSIGGSFDVGGGSLKLRHRYISGRHGMHNWAVEHNVAAFSELSFAVRWQGGVPLYFRLTEQSYACILFAFSQTLHPSFASV